MNLNKPVFLASSSDEASSQKKILEDKYGKNELDNADVIVVLGGDGFMLEAIKSLMDKHLPIFGLNYGSVGFLMNSSNQNDLVKPITEECEIVTIPFRSDIGGKITKVMNTGKFEILGIQEDGSWTMEIIVRKIDKPIYTNKNE